MKQAVVAVTPTLSDEPEKMERLCRQINALQKLGVLGSVSIASVMHPDLYPYPASYYQLLKFGLSHHNRDRLEGFMKKRFQFQKVHMLSAPSSENYTLAESLSDFARKSRADVLVVSQSGNLRWQKRLLGRVSEATAFSATLPVLVLSTEHCLENAASDPKILFGIDPRVMPTEAELKQLVKAAGLMRAEVHLVHVRPANRVFSEAFGKPIPVGIVMKRLHRLEFQLRAEGIRARSVILEEGASVAASMEKYAKNNHIAIAAVTTPARPLLRRFLLGSTARRLLKASRRPVLLVRADHEQAKEIEMRQKTSRRGIVASQIDHARSATV